MEAPVVIPVRTASRSYDVVIGDGVLGSAAGRIAAAVPSARRVHVIADDGVPSEVLAELRRHVEASGHSVSSSLVRATEEGKSLQAVHHLVQDIAMHGLERGDCVVALGGGITGDMAGFAAAMYRRGIPWVNCPTTLLAMVDASVGGKTGVNLRVGLGAKSTLQKNMAGAFWQPSLVLADVGVLETLDERVYRCGLAECIKHGMLSAGFDDPGLMHWMKGSLGAIGERDAAVLTELVSRNVAVKARVVGTDEREEAAGDQGRALLNLGHTFGHAMETMPGLSPGTDGGGEPGPLHHGEAVALGLVCAARCAEELRLVGAGFTDGVRRVLEIAGLPVVARGLKSPAEVYERMWADKKVAAGTMRLVLPVGEGVCRVVGAPEEGVVVRAIEAVRG
jgi:3-dehydroquinate synthetase